VLRNAASIARHPGWALEFGTALSLASHGPLGFAAVSAATPGEGFQVLAEFAPIRAPFLGFAAEQVDQQLLLRVDSNRYDLGDLELPAIEIVLQVARGYVGAVCGDDAVDTTCYFARPRPPHARSFVLGQRLSWVFGAAFNGLAVPASLRGLPCPLHDEKTYRAALLRCHEALDAVLSPDDVVGRSSHWLAAHFDEFAAGRGAPRQPRLEELARGPVHRATYAGAPARRWRHQFHGAACRATASDRVPAARRCALYGRRDRGTARR
jgi:hypothetical protein